MPLAIATLRTWQKQRKLPVGAGDFSIRVLKPFFWLGGSLAMCRGCVSLAAGFGRCLRARGSQRLGWLPTRW